MPKFSVSINGDTCKGCDLCHAVCPKKIIVKDTHINNKGYSPATIGKMEDCIGCKACALICPDGAIAIYKEVAEV